MTDETKYKGEKYRGPGHRAPYPLSRLAPAFELVELAKDIAAANDQLTSQAAGKLRLLAEQIEELRERARRILEETKRHQELHRARCAFRKVPGCSYHLYRRPDGTLQFSLIGPGEWGRGRSQPPFAFVGTYRLEPDLTWHRDREGDKEPG